MSNEKIVAQVAIVETKVDTLSDDIRDMREETREDRDVFWTQFRREQTRTNENEKKIIELLHKAETDRNQLRNDLKNYKGECDERFAEAASEKKSRITYMQGFLILICSGIATAAWDIIKKLTGLA